MTDDGFASSPLYTHGRTSSSSLVHAVRGRSLPSSASRVVCVLSPLRFNSMVLSPAHRTFVRYSRTHSMEADCSSATRKSAKTYFIPSQSQKSGTPLSIFAFGADVHMHGLLRILFITLFVCSELFGCPAP